MTGFENVWDSSDRQEPTAINNHQAQLIEEYLCEMFKPFCQSKPKDSIDLNSPEAKDLFSGESVELNERRSSKSISISVDKEGPVRLDLDASAPGVDWGEKNAESAAMSVYVDGKYQSDVVLFAGEKTNKYSVSLGDLAKGDHRITLKYADQKSSLDASGVVIDSASIEKAEFTSKEEEWAFKNAPVLIGRSGLDNNHTDTPLSMFHDIERQQDGSLEISYGYVFSNEDGGTARNPALEQARYGRLTDMETVFKVHLDRNGNVLERKYESKGHKWKDFKGEFDGSHPIIRTKTDNNTVVDDFKDEPEKQLRFAMTTDYRAPERLPLEDLMRQNPLWWEIQSKELFRENKIDLDGKGSKPGGDLKDKIGLFIKEHGPGKMPKMADPRSYVYVQFKAPQASEDSVEARVMLKSDCTWYSATRGEGEAEVDHDGWSQTAVYLPPGTRPEDIERIEFKSGDKGKVTEVGNMFMLDENYKPVEVDSQSYWHRKNYGAIPIDFGPASIAALTPEQYYAVKEMISGAFAGIPWLGLS